MKTSMFSVETRELSKCAFPDAVSTITICQFLISKINVFFRISSLHFIADDFSTSVSQSNGAKKNSRNPAHKMSLSAAMERDSLQRKYDSATEEVLHLKAHNFHC